MGCCCSTENDQYAEQGRRLAVHPAIASAAKSPYRSPPVQPAASRQGPGRNPDRNSKPVPGSVIMSVDELVWPALDRTQARRPGNRHGPARNLSILSADPQKEFRNMPELVSPVLPPEGVYYEGYSPPVPEKIPEEHPDPNRVAHGPPARPPKVLEGMQREGQQPLIELSPALPPRPNRVPGEAAPAPLTKDPHPIFAELSSQRRIAELAGLPPPAELDDTLVPNPQHEQVRFRYRDAVPYAPNFSELPAQALPVSPSGSLYSPHSVGSEMNQGLHGSTVQPRIASPRHADSIREMDVAGVITYELGDRQRLPHRPAAESLVPSHG